MSSIPNKADQTKKGLNDPFAKRDQNKPSSVANAASNQKANLNTKQKINMLNSRQKLAEQLLSGEAEVEVPKHSEQTAEKKAPPKFKRPGMKSENDPNADKKPKVNLDDLLDNYEKHELPEADLNKISSQDVVAETQKAPISSGNLRSFNPNKEFEIEKQGIESPASETEKGKKTNLFGNQEVTDLSIGKSSEKNLEKNKNKIDAQINFQNNKEAPTELEPLNANLVSGNQERIDMVFNNEEAEEQNTTSHMNLNPSENTFDEINITSNNENTNTSKFKGIGSTTSINPKNANFEDGGFSNNLFESTTSHTKNFFENLSASNNQSDLNNNNPNNNLINNSNNNTLNYSNAVINLGSEKTVGASQSNNNLTINPNTNNNSEKDLLGVNAKQADNIDFHINANQHESKSSNTNSENNHTSQGEDNLSIPEINCKSIELTNENFTNEKKHSTNSSNMNLNNQSNGNYQDIKEISGEANNFFSSLKDENAANKPSYYNNKAISVTNFEEASSSKQANKSSKNIKDFSENFNEKEILSSIVSEEKEENNANDFNKGNKIEKYAIEANEIINDNHVESGLFSEKHRIQILENEIDNLRKIISEYKRKEIEENESMLKLEIVNLRNTVKAKSFENELLQGENKNLKNHVKMLQENIEIYFSGENKSNLVDKVESKEPKKIETEAKQEVKVKEELNKEVKETKPEHVEHKTELTEKPSSIFDSEATRNTNAFSDSNVSSTIFNSNSTQNTTLDSAGLKKNKIPENTQRKKAGPVVANPPPPFKMQNKNAINFSNPSALFESTSSQSTGKSTGLFD